MQKEALQKEHFSLRNHISLFIPSGLFGLFGTFSGLEKHRGDSENAQVIQNNITVILFCG